MQYEDTWKDPVGCHPKGDEVEQYSMNRLAGRDLQCFEEHLLGCPTCQLRVIESDQFVAATCTALHETLQRKAPRREFLFKNVFIAHGGPSLGHVEAISDLLIALGLRPVIARKMPSLGFSVHAKVRNWMRICRSAIVLASSDGEFPSTRSRTRPNIDHEVGMLQTAPNIGNRIVYMKEACVRLASNYSEKAWIVFRKERIQEAFIPLIKELRAFSS